MIMSSDANTEGPSAVSAETVQYSKQSRLLFRVDDELNNTLLMFGLSKFDASNGEYSLFSIHVHNKLSNTHTYTYIYSHTTSKCIRININIH